LENSLGPDNSATSSVDAATPVANPGPVLRLDPTLAQVAGVSSRLDSPPANFLHAPVLPATFAPVLPATSVASNTLLVAPVLNNNPLAITPSHGRFLLPPEKIERLSKKPTRAQVVQVTTNLRRDNCHYLPVDVVLQEHYMSFETLLMRQYVMQPSRMAECSNWKHWDRERFCEELLSAVPDMSVVRPDSATGFVELISQLAVTFNLAEPSVEEVFDQQLQAIVHRFPDATPEQHLKAVQILVSRLPEQPTNWRAILSRRIDGQEVHLDTVNGFRFTWLAQLAKARNIKEMAEEFGYVVSYSNNTRLTVDKQIKKTLSFEEKTPTAGKSTAGLLCSGCGRENHLVATCRFKATEFFNSYPYAYKGSKAHTALVAKHPDASFIPFSELSKDTPRAPASGSSASKYGPKSAGTSMTVSDILSTIYNDNSDNNYIDVSVSATLQASTRRRNNVKALLDTGSLAGDFVAFRTIQALNLDPFILTHGSKLVCSGLDNSCYDVSSYIALQVSYFSENLNNYASIELKATVLNSSPIDLVIGRDTIRKYNLFSEIPSQLATRPTMSTVTSRPVSACCKDTGSSCGCQPKSRSLLLDGSPKGQFSSPKPDLAASQTRGILGALVDNSEHILRRAAVDVDEIDEASSDTFLPWSPRFFDSDPLAKIHVFGDEFQRKQILDLCEEFRDIFSNELDEAPALVPPFDLKVDDTKWKVRGNRAPPRPQTTANQADMVTQIKTLLQQGIIEKSQSAHYSQILMVPKPDGSRRMCVDFRNLNECTEDASFPIPHPKQMFSRIGAQKPKYFGTMDFTQGYHQAPLSMATRVYTSFIMFSGVYQFTRLPFGLKRAPSYFQEVMATIVLAGLIYLICEMYIDDCIVYGSDMNEFVDRLRQIFMRFRKHHLFLKASKCHFGYTEIEYVGKVISEKGLKMSQEKIRSVLDFPVPSVSKQLKSFLGLTNYFRDFVRNHSAIVKPLNSMLSNYSKTKKVEWTAETLAAFESIKNEVAKCTTMHFLNDTDPICLHTDASDYGIGGYLFQVVDGKEHPIAFVSKSLSLSQIRWAVIQKEAYAIFFVCMYLKSLLRDRKFTLRTDHRNLLYITENSNPMIVRWYMALSEYSFNLEFISGETNEVADSMSRLCRNNMKDSPREYSDKVILSANIIEKFTLTQVQYRTISSVHNSHVGHFGLDRTLKRLKAIGKVWEFQRQHVRYFIDHCPCCQKMSLLKIPIHAHGFTTSTYTPMECLNIDFVGPFPDDGYVFVIVDTFTRWVELYHTLDATALSAAQCLLKHFGRFGAPLQLRSDNGPHFVADVIREFLMLIGTQHCLTLAYSKEENALVERMNKEINRHLRALTFENTSLHKYADSLPFVQRILNSNYSDRLKISAAQLLFGNIVNLDRGIFLPRDERPTTSKLSKHMSELLSIQDSLLKASAKELLRTDLLHLSSEQQAAHTEFEPNSYVLVHYRTGAPPSRLHTFWRGPMQVMSGRNSRYLLKDLVTHKEKEYHVSDMKPFKFDPSTTNPLDIARRDHLEFFVEKVFGHRGDLKFRKDIEFHVKWLNYDESHDSWEPYAALRDTAQLHEYLRLHKLEKLIPRKFKT
jgi:transposase InsO family protein